MKAPLSPNEFEILNHQAGTINTQLAEIANLLETRLGETAELAVSARTVQLDFAALAHKIHAEMVKVAGIPTTSVGKARTAGNGAA